MIIYLDTSAFIKLYILEPGSHPVNKIVSLNSKPLPISDLLVIEFYNALKLKVFRDELTKKAFDQLIESFQSRKKEGIYYSPELDRKEHTDLCLSLTENSTEFGCRSLDIMHVAAAKLFTVDQFITFDERQAHLAEHVGLSVIKPNRD